MIAKLLKANGKIVHQPTVRSLTEEEQLDEKHQELRQQFDQNIKRKLGERIDKGDVGEEYQTPTFDSYQDDDDPPVDYALERDSVNTDAYDKYLHTEVLLSKGDKMVTGTVKRRKVNSSGEFIGKAAANPILDMRVYDVQFPRRFGSSNLSQCSC